MAFQTVGRLRELLEQAGARPRKRYGQNFLIDRHLMMRLVESAQIGCGDVVVEVGAGTGSLTSLLAERAGQVHTFEIDRTMADIAARELAGCDNVTLHRADALESQTRLTPEVVGVLEANAGRVKLTANLPYDVATPLLMNLLLAEHPPIRMCFTIQREVGERLMAETDTRDYGPASVLCRLYARTERIARLGPQAFWPPPKVESVMMRMEMLDGSTAAQRRSVAEVTRAAFTMRRKTLRRALEGVLGRERIESVLNAAGLRADMRPAEVGPAQWQALALQS